MSRKLNNMLRFFIVVLLLATQSFAMGEKPMEKPFDPMQPDSKVVLSTGEAAKILDTLKQTLSSELSGIDVNVNFMLYDDFKMSARLWQPDLWIGNYAVEVYIKDKSPEEIRDKVMATIKQAKEQVEGE